jgi:hypothetical protein
LEYKLLFQRLTFASNRTVWRKREGN